MPKQMMQQIPQFMNKKNLWKIGGGDLGLSIQSHLHLLFASPLPINSKCRKKNHRYCYYLLQTKLHWKCSTLCPFYLPYLFSKFNFNRHFFLFIFPREEPLRTAIEGTYWQKCLSVWCIWRGLTLFSNHYSDSHKMFPTCSITSHSYLE